MTTHDDENLFNLFNGMLDEFEVLMYRPSDGLEIFVSSPIAVKVLESCGFKKGKKNVNKNQGN